MINSRSLRATALLALVNSAPLFGAAYVGSAYEGFNYTAGNMTNTLNGGTGWNATGDALLANTTSWGVTSPAGNVFNLGATAANQAITGSTLNYASSAYPAETGASTLITGSGQAGRSFGQTVDSGSFYFSFLTKKTIAQLRTVNFSFFGSTGASTAPSERLALGQFASNTTLKLPDGSADPDAAAKANKGEFAALVSAPQSGLGVAGIYTATSPVSYAADATFLVVGKFDFNVSGAADRFTLYLNPGSLADEGAASAYLQLTGIDFGSLVGFRMFAGATSGSFTASAAEFDEIRLGTTYNAVTGVLAIPEPSSVTALAGLAGLAFAASRRRRTRD